MAEMLLTILFLPLAGAVMIRGDHRRARRIALVTALVTAGLAAGLVFRFPAGMVGPFGAVDVPWLGAAGGPIDARLSLGLDGLSVWLFGLTALLSVVAVLVGWEAIRQQASLYYRLLMLLQTGMLGVFAARDVILFYVFFEFTLIPLYFLIGIWGSQQRRYAANKFFLYTLAGSVLTFLGLLAVVLWDYHHAGSGRMTFSIDLLTGRLAAAPIDPAVQTAVFWALFAGFAIKVPLFPLHTWLPLAHVEAPAAGSVLLAGVLLKIGTYGFLRFALPLTPEAAVAAMPWLLGLSTAAILHGGLVALAQKDMKRLIAYSSVSHMGFCMLGLFALNALGTEGSLLQMVNHGLATGGLFALVGMLYERYHTRDIADYGGLARKMPRAAFFMVVLTLSSIGLPGLGGFAGELLILIGMFDRAWAASTPVALAVPYRVMAVASVGGVVIGAWYMLWLVQRVFFGPLREPKVEHHDAGAPLSADLNPREVATLVPLIVMTLWIGLWPGFFLDRANPTLRQLTEPARRAMERHASNDARPNAQEAHRS